MKAIQFRFNILKNKIKFFFNRLKLKSKSFVENNSFKKTKKSTVVSMVCVWILATISITLTAAITAHTPINKSQSIAELIYNNNNGNDTMGFLTPFETSKNTFTLCSVQPEKSAKFRNLNASAELYDCYPANYLNTSPATVDFIDGANVNVSFVLIPKENYTNSYFTEPHAFKLLVGGTSSSSNAEDIYINKRYADKLILDNPDIDNYDQLLNTRITLPYTNAYVKKIDLDYVIKGVIDDNDEKYLRYKSFIGDFFLANQYVNIPINGNLLFELPNKIDAIKDMVDSLFKIYNYDTIGRYFSALSFTMAYEYRIYEVESIELNQNDIYKINDKTNVLFSKYNSVYNYYLTKSYIIPLILISFALLVSLIIAIVLLKSIYSDECSTKTNFGVFSALLLAFPTAIGTNYLYKLLFLRSVCVSIASWQTFVFMLFPLIVLFIMWFILKRICQSNCVRT